MRAPSGFLTPGEIKQRIATATAELAGAEQDLRTSLDALPSTLRAEKRIVSASLQAALAKLSEAKKRLLGVIEAAG